MKPYGILESKQFFGKVCTVSWNTTVTVLLCMCVWLWYLYGYL